MQSAQHRLREHDEALANTMSRLMIRVILSDAENERHSR
jgi:hypothetical protein